MLWPAATVPDMLQGIGQRKVESAYGSNLHCGAEVAVFDEVQRLTNTRPESGVRTKAPPFELIVVRRYF